MKRSHSPDARRFAPLVRCLWLLGCTLALNLSFTGCGRQAKPPEALTPEEVPGVVETAFQEGSSGTREAASDVVAAVQANDSPRAYIELQNLLGRPDLTPEQRSAAARSLVTVGAQLSAAAEAGDSTAAQVLKAHQAGK